MSSPSSTSTSATPFTPAPSLLTYPGIFDDVAPVEILGYPIATVQAKRLTIVIQMGAANIRTRD